MNYSLDDIKQAIARVRKFEVERPKNPSVDGLDWNRALTTIDPAELVYVLERMKDKKK